MYEALLLQRFLSRNPSRCVSSERFQPHPTPMIWEEESHSCSVRAPGDLDSHMVFWVICLVETATAIAFWAHFGPILGPFAHPLLNLLRQTSGDVIHSCSGEPQHFYYGSNETVTWEQDRLTWGRFLVVAFVYCASTILEG
jgi:hypothetical protein